MLAINLHSNIFKLIRDNKKISSYSIDGVSKTFKIMSNDEYISSKKEILKYLPDELTKYL